jgi:hypothetical protein
MGSKHIIPGGYPMFRWTEFFGRHPVSFPFMSGITLPTACNQLGGVGTFQEHSPTFDDWSGKKSHRKLGVKFSHLGFI